MQTIYEASILLVDDNPDLLVLVGDSLRTAGYTCIRTAATCAEARALFAAAAPELMILDINLPDGDGFTLLRQLHAKADVPALFLSARDADADRLLGLGLGADDYLTKPFLMQELLLRVQRILQRAYRAELCRAAPPALELGDCQVDLAEKLNETGEQLRRRNEIIARRDTARTDWIAGVSHDIRTPLALILGWGEQLQQDEALPAAARQKAAGICTQSEKIRSLIGDLNLTSKLQYGAQPLRRKAVAVGPFLRRCAAEFYESPAAGDSTLELELTQAAEHTVVQADEALLLRAIENLLHNTVGHNAAPVHVTIRADAADGMLTIKVTDDGQGYPPAVLAVLQAGETGENPPHILGLHVVEQILAAHGGTATFAQALPHGAAAALTLPL